jgi:multimeric flavodoxin WrbA
MGDLLRAKRPRILILNAALAGGEGNTAVGLERVRRALARGGKAEVRVVTLVGECASDDAVGGKGAKGFAEVKAELAWAEAFVFGTGTHWDSWSSVLQRFLEDATEAEGTKVWLGKPVACVVTEHSVGGKGVLSRLQGVLVTLGCLIPPMSGVVLSKVAQMAGGHSLALVATEAKRTEDFWGAEDLKIVAHNLVEAVNGTRKWKAWAVDREDFEKRWMR